MAAPTFGERPGVSRIPVGVGRPTPPQPIPSVSSANLPLSGRRRVARHSTRPLCINERLYVNAALVAHYGDSPSSRTPWLGILESPVRQN